MAKTQSTAGRYQGNDLLRTDPTRTSTLRAKYNRELQKFWTEFTADLEGFFLQEEITANSLWDVLSLKDRLETFRTWLTSKLTNTKSVEDISDGVIEDTFSKGQERGLFAAKDIDLDEEVQDLSVAKGRLSLLASIKGAANTRLGLLKTKVRDNIKAVTQSVLGRLSETLSKALLAKEPVSVLLKKMKQVIKKTGRLRFKQIANTEVVRAINEAILTTFEFLGIKKVGVQVEWVTAGDSKVCRYCASMNGRKFSVENSYGMLPAHVNCRCIFIPYRPTA